MGKQTHKSQSYKRYKSKKLNMRLTCATKINKWYVTCTCLKNNYSILKIMKTLIKYSITFYRRSRRRCTKKAVECVVDARLKIQYTFEISTLCIRVFK